MTFKNEFYEYIKNMPNVPGSYDVGITNTKTDETHETQGDIPDEDYTWDDFFEWLVQDIKEMDLDITDITLDYIEYAGELDID